MKKTYLFWIIAQTLVAISYSTKWNLVWSDDFEGTTLDTSKWSYEVDCWGGGNNELQCYTSRADNVKLEGGNLILEAKREPGYTGSTYGCTIDGNCLGPKDYTSGRIRTLHHADWLRGRFEMRAKLPKGKHLWPAFWMLPTNYTYGSWAASGEIDIMEYRGQLTNQILGTIHYSSEWPNNRYTSSGGVDFPYDFSADFHLFAIEWDTTSFRWYVDSQKYFEQNIDRNFWEGAGTNHYTKNGQPWDQKFHIILNLAIGGGFFNGMGDLTPQDVLNTWVAPQYVIDYVKVYQETPVTTTTTSVGGTGDYQLVWSDEFDGTSIDLSKWNLETDCWGGGNNEAQCYTARTDNIYIQNGALVIEAKHEPGYPGTYNNCTNPQGCLGPRDYTSGKINSNTGKLGSWKYGKFSMRAKLPTGDFLWPAFWMLPTDWLYGTWAASGEIDIMEFKGQNRNKVLGTIHYGGAWPNNRYTGTEQTYPFNFNDDFHEFSLEWDMDNMVWFVDGQQYFQQSLNRDFYSGVGPDPYTANRQPFDQRFHILINLAIAGNFFNGMGTFTGDLSTWTNPKYVIDYIRVYQINPGVNATLINPEADVHVRSDDKTNQGNSQSMVVQYDPANLKNSIAFLRFNVQPFLDSTIKSAHLNMTIVTPPSVDTNVTVTMCTCWWDENNLVWSAAPGVGSYVNSTIVSTVSTKLEVDVTGALNIAMTRDYRLSFRLSIENAQKLVSITFGSKESSNKPVLTVVTV